MKVFRGCAMMALGAISIFYASRGGGFLTPVGRAAVGGGIVVLGLLEFADWLMDKLGWTLGDKPGGVP